MSAELRLGERGILYLSPLSALALEVGNPEDLGGLPRSRGGDEELGSYLIGEETATRMSFQDIKDHRRECTPPKLSESRLGLNGLDMPAVPPGVGELGLSDDGTGEDSMPSGNSGLLDIADPGAFFLAEARLARGVLCCEADWRVVRLLVGDVDMIGMFDVDWLR